MEITVEELNELLEKATEDAFKRYNNQKGKQIYIPAWIYNDSTSFPPDACKNCSNYPSNGGSGNCNCILGNTTITY